MVVEFREAVYSGVDSGQVVGQVLAFPELALPSSECVAPSRFATWGFATGRDASPPAPLN